MKLGYFPGCSLHGLAREYGGSVQAVCALLGIGLRQIPDWSCCGASAAHSRSRDAALDLSARNLALAEQAGLGEIATACAGCFNRLKRAAHDLKKSERARERAERLANHPVSGNIEVKHLLGVFSEPDIKNRISSAVKQPLTGTRLAAYYGCMLSRPSAVMEFDDAEQPQAMDDLFKLLGAQTAAWPHKAECCGGSLAAAEPGLALELSGEILASAREAGADAIAVACPMCQANLDLRQKEIEKLRGEKFNLPIIYFTQLMGLAFGIAPGRLGFGLLMTSPSEFLRRVSR